MFVRFLIRSLALKSLQLAIVDSTTGNSTAPDMQIFLLPPTPKKMHQLKKTRPSPTIQCGEEIKQSENCRAMQN